MRKRKNTFGQEAKFAFMETYLWDFPCDSWAQKHTYAVSVFSFRGRGARKNASIGELRWRPWTYRLEKKVTIMVSRTNVADSAVPLWAFDHRPEKAESISLQT